MKTTAALPLRIITHNIRYATTRPSVGEEAWSVRAPRLLNELRFHTVYIREAFVCLQEVLHGQLVDIMASINGASCDHAKDESGDHGKTTNAAEWAFLGVGRDDGLEAGEYSPILYRPTVWHVEDYQHFWLSETPNVPSLGWDADNVRIVTVGRFFHRESSKRILLLNTHLDNAGRNSRRKSAQLITSFINDYLREHDSGGGLPVVLTGDMNSETSGEAHQYFSNSPSRVRDIRDSIPEKNRYGNKYTYTGFSEADGPPARIDFIFAGPCDDATSTIRRYKQYAVIANQFDDSVYVSDHRAVLGDLDL